MQRIHYRILIFCVFFISLGIPAIAQSANHRDSVDVIHYAIHLDIMDFSNREISGYTELQLTSAGDSLFSTGLDLLKLNIDSVWLDSAAVSNYTYNDTVIRINERSLSKNDTVVVRIFYHGQPFSEDWGGFYFDLSQNIAYNLGVGFDADPHNLGRAWFPCIDNFTDRAAYDYYITTQKQHRAICNGELISVTNIGDTADTYHWKLEETIPTYLASVVAGDYAVVTDTFQSMQGSKPVEIYVKSADSMDAVNSFINIADIAEGYEEYFGAYRWDRIGYTATTLGAMEHPTNIAMPASTINGTLYYEWLFAHELSHHWFGDLATCKTAENMWINEGWAVFCEYLYKEMLYGTEARKNYARNKIREVLRYAHIEDGGYRAVYGIPHEYTYGSTVYEKGAAVVHSLRGYLGDSIFFDAVKAYLDTFAFKAVDSYEMRDFFSAHTGVDLTDFFDTWVFSPGFIHFSVDSFSVQNAGSDYEVTVFVRQRLKEAPDFANSNIVEITFMDDQWQQYTDTIHFSGESGSKTVAVPFAPSLAMPDLEEKTADATSDKFLIACSTGIYDFSDTYFSMDINNIDDSAFIRAVHNWVAPDGFKEAKPGLRISGYRYWKIEGILPAGFEGTGYFYYDKLQYLDYDLITSTSRDSIAIAYRESTADDWRIIDFSFKSPSNAYSGYIRVDNLQLGEYALVYGDWQGYAGLKNETNDSESQGNLKIFPNPSENLVHFEYDISGKGALIILDNTGRQIIHKTLSHTDTSLTWQPENAYSGLFHVYLYENKQLKAVEAFVFSTKY